MLRIAGHRLCGAGLRPRLLAPGRNLASGGGLDPERGLALFDINNSLAIIRNTEPCWKSAILKP